MFAARHVFPESAGDKENYKAGCDSLSSSAGGLIR
jgi:hypothetical protein